MAGERYENGMLEGFLFGRGQLAMGYILAHVSGEEVLPADQHQAWQDVVEYASAALSEYQENGDSQEVIDLTAKMMDATDHALELRRNA